MQKLQLELFLPYLLNRVSELVSRDFRSVYGRHHDLSVPEWRVLATLGEFEEMTAKAIGAHSFMHKTKVSRAVRALEERRWLRRRESANDRREETLSLTTAGRRTYAEIVPRAIEFEAALRVALGADSGPLLRALHRLDAHAGVRAKGGCDQVGSGKKVGVRTVG